MKRGRECAVGEEPYVLTTYLILLASLVRPA